MKISRTPLIVAIVLIWSTFDISISTGKEPAQLSLMSYNIRLDIASDGENRWDNRKKALSSQILFHSPEILGIQEGLPQQVDYLAQALDGYEYIGIGRDDGKRAGEFSAIFYKAESAEVIESDTFWLSETPSEPSFGWGVSYRRICTYGHFRDKSTGQSYWVFNTHFDHQVAEARLNGAKLILERIGQLVPEGTPYFLMGDLNAPPESPEIILLSETLRDARLHATRALFGQEGTFNGFDPTAIPMRRIDYIFTSRDTVQTKNFATLSDLVNGRFVSDHFPVIAHCTISSE